MKRVLTVVALMLSACHYTLPWEAAPAPLDVYISSELSDEHALGVADGAAWWNEHVNGVLKGVTASDSPPCGTVVVTYGCVDHAAETLSYDGCHTHLRLSRTLEPERAWRAVAHELGHALLGEEHDAHEGNVLERACTKAERELKLPECTPFKGWSVEPTLTGEQVERIRARMAP
jgi:hypothetical protein